MFGLQLALKKFYVGKWEVAHFKITLTKNIDLELKNNSAFKLNSISINRNS